MTDRKIVNTQGNTSTGSNNLYKMNNNPRTITSNRKIVYRKSNWRVHQFKIISGDALCTVAVLQMDGSLFLWVGGSENKLVEMALGMPPIGDGLSSKTGLASTLLGAEGIGTTMARRLAVQLNRPVYVCSGSEFDRFTIPLVERGLIAEIKSRPEIFS